MSQGTEPSTWKKILRPFQAFLIDAILIWLGILMVEFLIIAFSGRRSPTGFLLLAEGLSVKIEKVSPRQFTGTRQCLCLQGS